MPSAENAPFTGARLLVAQLALHGVDRIFCVPGESYLAVLDALVDVPQIAVVTCRQEGGAAMMAEAYGKLTGRPGIAFVTRGPGATNASAGVHVAHQDSTPLILFIGQIERAATGRGAFQEVDYSAMFGPLAKWAAQIEDGARIPELVSRAFHTATAGRPGPVVLALPEDMLMDGVEPQAARPYRAAQAHLAPEDAQEIGGALAAAQRPVVIVGGGGWSQAASADAGAFAQAWDLPLIAAFRCNDYIDNAHPNYVGNLGLGPNPDLVAAVRGADLILAVGARFGEVTSAGYGLLAIPDPAQNLIQIHAEPAELGRIYQPDLAYVANATSSFARLKALEAPVARPWAGAREALRSSFLAWTTPPAIPGALQMGAVMEVLRARLPADAILANGAGNFAIWPNRFHRYCGFGTMLAPTSGSMGYGLPAAVAAKLQFPDRTVVAFVGDGDFLMTGQELATAMKEDAAIVVLLVNNGMYGTIRMHQEREYPRRVSATTLANPDFVQYARAFGAYGERVERTEEFEPALDRALACGRSAILELMLDPDVLSPTLTISALRAKAGA
ncbi:thiamine pyrophosphate-binding protein [Xanthobacter sp. DSM 24535]|uniref:thiamine pyrophosphate-binding protein n=1 Tax=Roseixanthobacter psychrophilus TaxID=3119917 RepID=UPI0037295CA8